MKLPIKLNPKDSITVFLVAFVLLAIPLTVVTIISQRDQRSKAAGTASFSFSPSTQTINQNTQFTVDIKLNSGIDQVQSGQVVFTYPTAMLDIVPFTPTQFYDASTSNFDVLFADPAAPAGTVNLTFARTGATIPSGNLQIARITFKSKAATGVAALAFSSYASPNGGDPYQTQAVNPAGVNLLAPSNGTINGSYTIIDPAPTVGITYPTASTGVVNGTVTVTADATDNNSVARVDFYVDASNTPTSDPTPNAGTNTYSFLWDTTTLTNVSHTVKAIAVDSAGISTPVPSTVSVIVDNSRPTVTLTAPTTSATPYRGPVVVTATAADNRALANVQFFVDGSLTPLQTILAPGPYTFNWDTTIVSNTTHTITARATDTVVGNVSSPVASVTITVDNAKPTVPVLTATAISETQINLSWTASTDTQGSVTYDVYRNNVKINPTSLSTTTYPDNGLTASTSYSYYIQAKDVAGNTNPSNTVSATTRAAPRFGDVTGDGRVNILDISSIINNWDATSKPVQDINQDGRVNILDISLVIANWF